MGSLVAAYSVAWLVLLIYVLTLAARQRKLERRLAGLDADTGAVSARETKAQAAGPHGR